MVLKNAAEQIIERISLADLHLVKPLVNDRARLAGYLRRAVCAIIRNHDHVQQFGGIVLPLKAFDQVADHVLLVARGDNRRIAVQRGGLLPAFPFSEEADQQVNDLVRIGCGKKYE